jgi:hypothetical protein
MTATRTKYPRQGPFIGRESARGKCFRLLKALGSLMPVIYLYSGLPRTAGRAYAAYNIQVAVASLGGGLEDRRWGW